MQSYLSETLIEPTEFMRSMHILGLDQRGEMRVRQVPLPSDSRDVRARAELVNVSTLSGDQNDPLHVEVDPQFDMGDFLRSLPRESERVALLHVYSEHEVFLESGEVLSASPLAEGLRGAHDALLSASIAW